MVQKMKMWVFAVAIATGLAGTACAQQLSKARMELERHYNELRKAHDQSDFSFYKAPAEQCLLPRIDHLSPRNVIVLIGDGMGHNHITLARRRAVGLDGRLHMERMPITGLIRTHSANRIVTDSSAAATALACGIKTDNDRIGIAPDGVPFKTILQKARNKGFRTGLVATSAITHATPAAFAAHVEGRSMENEIAVQLLANRVDVLLGGGRRYWLPEPQGFRKDGRNLIETARIIGYQIIEHREQMAMLSNAPVLGLFADEGMTTFAPEPMLDEMTRVAIELLGAKSNDWFAPEPQFFIMIEGSQIDWAGHVNDADYLIRQTLLFDLAVKEALDFSLSDQQTLVIVVSDHETGGLVLGVEGERSAAVWTSQDHTSADVPLYAFGPGATLFSGTHHLSDIPKMISRLLQINNFPSPNGVARAKKQIAVP